MSEEKFEGGPAFPAVDNWRVDSGMKLRDYFAAKAMPIVADIYSNGHVDGWYGIARQAYKIADAMLEARK